MFYMINKSYPEYLPLPLYFSNKDPYKHRNERMKTDQSLVKNSKILLLRHFSFLTFLSLFPLPELNQLPQPLL